MTASCLLHLSLWYLVKEFSGRQEGLLRRWCSYEWWSEGLLWRSGSTIRLAVSLVKLSTLRVLCFCEGEGQRSNIERCKTDDDNKCTLPSVLSVLLLVFNWRIHFILYTNKNFIISRPSCCFGDLTDKGYHLVTQYLEGVTFCNSLIIYSFVNSFLNISPYFRT